MIFQNAGTKGLQDIPLHNHAREQVTEQECDARSQPKDNYGQQLDVKSCDGCSDRCVYPAPEETHDHDGSLTPDGYFAFALLGSKNDKMVKFFIFLG